MKRVIFLGTPLIALYALKALMKIDDLEIVAVVAQPDRMLDRKKQIQYLEVKQYCVDNNLLIYQPEKISEIKQEIIDLKPDLMITCAYGQFIPDSILEIPTIGSFNFHASLLPKWRGGAPIHWAVINNDSTTGWTLMKMVKKMDAGDYCAQEVVDVDTYETTESLYNKLCLGLDKFVKDNIAKLWDKNTTWIPQDESKVTLGLNIKKEDRIIDFSKGCVSVDCLVRGLYSKPIALWINKGVEIKVYSAKKSNIKSTTKPGTINQITKEGIFVSTSDFDIIFTKIQLPSKNVVEVNQVYHNESFKKELM